MGLQSRRGKARTVRVLALATLLGLLLGCEGIVPSPERQPSPDSTPGSTSPPIAAARITVGVHVGSDAVSSVSGLQAVDMPLFPMLANGRIWDRAVRRFVYSGVYRLNEMWEPVEDLAAEPCTWSEDLLVITCTLRPARFHDGAPLTAADVAFSFELIASDACQLDICVTNLAAAVAVDDRTVEFHLTEPDALFLTVALPEVLIESSQRILNSFARFTAGTRGAGPGVVTGDAERLSTALDTADGDCAALVTDAEVTVKGLGLKPWTRDEFNLGAGDAFDACAYGHYLARVLSDTAESLALDGTDAVAAAYRVLDFQDEMPIGSGPWKVRNVDPGKQLDLESFDAFHRGSPATSQLEVRLLRTKAEAVEAVRARAVDWLLQPFVGQAPSFLTDAVDGVAGLTLAEYDENFWFALHYNVRPGALFADARLREAMELCIDKAETVATATKGQFVPIQSPVLPSHWAYESRLRAPVKDILAATSLIEAAGWEIGPGGVYEKNGRRLSAQVPVRVHREDRLVFLGVLADQVADCGIEIEPLPLDPDAMPYDWPQSLPGTDQPWDLFFNGYVYSASTDPAVDYGIFHSSQITSEDNPMGTNMTGYSNPRVDDLLDRARSTYDQKVRGRLFREYQSILAEDRPMLFAWMPHFVEARSDRIGSVDGPLPESSAFWWWELEDLVLEEPAG